MVVIPSGVDFETICREEDGLAMAELVSVLEVDLELRRRARLLGAVRNAEEHCGPAAEVEDDLHLFVRGHGGLQSGRGPFAIRRLKLAEQARAWLNSEVIVEVCLPTSLLRQVAGRNEPVR
jgi:hypothetical protein